MGKLHELLAVEGNLETQANKCRAELQNTFEKKRHLMEKKITTFFPTDEKIAPVIEQQLDIQTTVVKELKWISDHIAKAIDAGFQVAKANTVAKADIILEGGDILAKDVPATSLLELEKRVNEVQQLAHHIPTLDPTKGFTMDANQGVYVARDINKIRTKKTNRVLVKYEATKEHPAQTEIVSEDVPVGKITEQEWSGMITPLEKANILSRIDILVRAIRSARSRANEVVVDSTAQIGKKLLDFVFKE